MNVTEEIKIDLGIKVGVWNFNISYLKFHLGKKYTALQFTYKASKLNAHLQFFEHKITDFDPSADARRVRTYKLMMCQITKNCDCG